MAEKAGKCKNETETESESKSRVIKLKYRKLSKTQLKGKDRYEFFYGKQSPFSQHHECNFQEDGIKYMCAEQYMMYKKAVFFNDKKMADEILRTTKPIKMKHYGRKIKNFDGYAWEHNAVRIVKCGNKAKFSQNKYLKRQLFKTYPKILAEASPMDKRWGIGMCSYNEKAWDQKHWTGRNLLGFAITDVRDELMRDEGLID